jgi:hypothetical protein
MNTKAKPDDNAVEIDDAQDAHDEIAFHAAFVVDLLLPDLANHHSICLQCLGREANDAAKAA